MQQKHHSTQRDFRLSRPLHPFLRSRHSYCPAYPYHQHLSKKGNVLLPMNDLSETVSWEVGAWFGKTRIINCNFTLSVRLYSTPKIGVSEYILCKLDTSLYTCSSFSRGSTLNPNTYPPLSSLLSITRAIPNLESLVRT